MSSSDLLFEMDVLFVLPALPLLTWAAAEVVARLARSAQATSRFGTATTLISYERPCGASKFHRT